MLPVDVLVPLLALDELVPSSRKMITNKQITVIVPATKAVFVGLKDSPSKIIVFILPQATKSMQRKFGCVVWGGSFPNR